MWVVFAAFYATMLAAANLAPQHFRNAIILAGGNGQGGRKWHNYVYVG